MQLRPLLLVYALLLGVFGSRASASPSVEDLVTTETLTLIKHVEASDAVFVRNGSEHTGKEAADHLRRKITGYGKKLSTAEFISKIASKSSTTGEVYKMKLPDGQVMTSEAWMLAELKKIREAVPAGSDKATTSTVTKAAPKPKPKN